MTVFTRHVLHRPFFSFQQKNPSQAMSAAETAQGYLTLSREREPSKKQFLFHLAAFVLGEEESLPSLIILPPVPHTPLLARKPPSPAQTSALNHLQRIWDAIVQ